MILRYNRSNKIAKFFLKGSVCKCLKVYVSEMISFSLIVFPAAQMNFFHKH